MRTKPAKLLLSTGNSCPNVSIRRHKVGICRRTCAASFVTKKVSTQDTAGKHRNSITRSTKDNKGFKAARGAYDRGKKGVGYLSPKTTRETL